MGRKGHLIGVRSGGPTADERRQASGDRVRQAEVAIYVDLTVTGEVDMMDIGAFLADQVRQGPYLVRGAIARVNESRCVRVSAPPADHQPEGAA